jgi:hypothetical protein
MYLWSERDGSSDTFQLLARFTLLLVPYCQMNNLPIGDYKGRFVTVT